MSSDGVVGSAGESGRERLSGWQGVWGPRPGEEGKNSLLKQALGLSVPNGEFWAPAAS